MTTFDIPYYLDYLSSELLQQAEEDGESVPGVDGLTVAAGLQSEFPDIETEDALRFVCDVYEATKEELNQVLEQRKRDREFIDATVAACAKENVGRAYLSPDYQTVISKKDSRGRVVVGPLPEAEQVAVEDLVRVEIPEFLEGEQVTLFGPPDTAKMSINAMNALHRKPAEEPSIIAELVEDSGEVPRWGADNEDSKTPIMRAFL